MSQIIRMFTRIIQLVFLLFIIQLFTLLDFSNAQEDPKPWFIYARSYVQAVDEAKSTENLFDKLAEMDSPLLERVVKIKDDNAKFFKEGKQPTIEDIERLFHSTEEDDQKTACAIVELSGKYSNIIIEKTIKNINASIRDDLRYQCIEALNRVSILDKEEIKKYGERIFESIDLKEDAAVDSGSGGTLGHKIIILNRIGYISKSGKGVLRNIILNSNNSMTIWSSHTLMKIHDSEYAAKVLKELKESEYEEHDTETRTAIMLITYREIPRFKRMIYTAIEFLSADEEIDLDEPFYSQDCIAAMISLTISGL